MAPQRPAKTPSRRRRSRAAAAAAPPTDEEPVAPIEPRVFRPTLANHEDAKEQLDEMLRVNDLEGTSRAGLPGSDLQRQELVKRLFTAMFNLRDVVENTTNQHYRYIANATHYADNIVETNLWRLLVS